LHLATIRSSETLRNTALAGFLASLIAWFAPPGTDFAAHVFQLHVYLQHGFALWSNYWYAGRYTFVGYSLIYYPLAALVGIRLLAVISVAASAAAFSLVVRRTWGETSPWVSRFFAVVAAASIVTAAFPYGLGLAFALAALVAIANRRLIWFSLLAALAFAASPLAFVFLLVVLGATAVARSPRDIGIPAAVLAAICVVALGLWRLFPDPGHYPFPISELIAALVFCALGAGLTWRVDRARVLHILFLAYGVACVGSYLIPTNLGGNIVRLRLVAVPIAILVLSLRRWRPLPLAVLAMGLALSWNFTPLAYSFFQTRHDPAAQATYWQPVVKYLRDTLTPDYRVEAVGTADHWEAVYLPQAGIPIVRGWFRQNDFPLNELLYDNMTPRAYLAWLHRLSVRYVVLTDSTPDYSAHEEARLLASGRSGLPVVFRSAHATVYAVPSPRPIVTGPGDPRVTAITESTITLRLSQPGTYQVGIRFTPYLHAHASCVTEAKDGMTVLSAPHAGRVKLAFRVSPSAALAALTGSRTTCAEG